MTPATFLAFRPCPCKGTGREPYYSGAKLRQVRKAAGLGLRQLAREIGVSASFLSDVERGNRNLTFTLLGDVIAALDKLSASGS